MYDCVRRVSNISFLNRMKTGKRGECVCVYVFSIHSILPLPNASPSPSSCHAMPMCMCALFQMPRINSCAHIRALIRTHMFTNSYGQKPSPFAFATCTTVNVCICVCVFGCTIGKIGLSYIIQAGWNGKTAKRELASRRPDHGSVKASLNVATKTSQKIFRNYYKTTLFISSRWYTCVHVCVYM